MDKNGPASRCISPSYTRRLSLKYTAGILAGLTVATAPVTGDTHTGSIEVDFDNVKDNDLLVEKNTQTSEKTIKSTISGNITNVEPGTKLLVDVYSPPEDGGWRIGEITEVESDNTFAVDLEDSFNQLDANIGDEFETSIVVSETKDGSYRWSYPKSSPDETKVATIDSIIVERIPNESEEDETEADKKEDSARNKRLMWDFKIGSGEVFSSPTVVDGTVFIGSLNGNLYALDANSGDQEWVFETGGYIWGSPTVVNGTVFIGSDDENLYAVDADSGDQEWVFETDTGFISSPTVVDKTVFTGSIDGNLYALDANSGDQEWVFETENHIESSPTVVDETVFIGSDDENLYAVDADSGDQEWMFKTEGQIFTSPTVANGTVFIGSGDDNLYAVDTDTGVQQWVFDMGNFVNSSPTVADSTVFVGSYEDFYAIDAETGYQEWRFETNGSNDTSPTVVDGTVFFVSSEGYLYAVNVDTGAKKWTFNAGGGGDSSPIVVDGTVFVASYEYLYAVDADITGSSEDTRVMLGTDGHHTDWKYADQSRKQISSDSSPGFTIGSGIAALGAGGYMLERRITDNTE